MASLSKLLSFRKKKKKRIKDDASKEARGDKILNLPRFRIIHAMEKFLLSSNSFKEAYLI